jgi:hypothetical protein
MYMNRVGRQVLAGTSLVLILTRVTYPELYWCCLPVTSCYLDLPNQTFSDMLT